MKQCEAMLDAGPAVVSSIMGIYPPGIVARMKEKGIRWLANVTTVAEAREAVAAGADVIVAQGMEAGGHRGSFDAERPDNALIGLFALLPAVADAVGDRSLPRGASRMRAVSRLPCSLVHLQFKSGPGFSERRRPNSHPPGPTPSARRNRRTPCQPALFLAGLAAA